MTAYEKIFLLNTLIGNKGVKPLSEDFWTQVRNQTELVVEEAAETLDACIEEDTKELIDGVADVMVVAIGLFQKLQLCGVDIDMALDLVCNNNLEKFHKTAEHANETVDYYRAKEVETFVRLSTMEDGVEYYAVIRKGDGKMLKPHDFVGVDLSEIVEMVTKVSEMDSE
jgi:hypothetical protein